MAGASGGATAYSRLDKRQSFFALGWLMFGVDPDIGNSALRLWVAVGSGALLVFVCALALDWTRTRIVARIGVVVLGAFLGATLAWAFLDAASVRDRSADRRALEARMAALDAESLAPGSPLACLNGLAGENVETACEKALFAAPATVASATSYVAARLSLLADMVAYGKRGGGNIDRMLLPLRHSLEADRFGFVAHTLAVADGCTSDQCKAFALLDNSRHIRANLSGQTLDRYLDHYLTVWAQPPDVPIADASSASPPAAPPHKVVDIDFPTSESIPAISIMNPEPKGPPGAAAVAAATAGEADAHDAPAASRRPRKPAVPAPVPTSASPPPPADVDPVWTPGTQPPPAAATANPTAAGVAPGVGGPVQLGPFPPPQASAGAAHAQ